MRDYFLDPNELAAGEAAIWEENSPWGPCWLAHRDPVDILIAYDLGDVPLCLEQASRHAEEGWTVGLVAYEAAPAFDPKRSTYPPTGRPLAWFALYGRPPDRHRELAPVYEEVVLEELTSEWSQAEYAEAFAYVREALAAGATYQVNLTFRQRFRVKRPAGKFFANRCGVRPPRYAAYLNGGDWQIASFSPELFFERREDRVRCVPMKGTAVADPNGDIPPLADDPKSRAENVMIVDMVRNDLGVVAEPGTVKTPRLLQLERHRGLWQMVSTVEARSSRPTPELFDALFPPASVTGAPKVATMRLIRDLETSPRGPYCGAIGVMSPKYQRFSVAIRTAVLENGNGEFGVGSGVVWDSVGSAEYQECLAKRELLLKPGLPWALIEALSTNDLQPSKALAAHLDRLEAGAAELGIAIDRERLARELQAVTFSPKSLRLKVRIAVRRTGDWDISVGPSAIGGDRITAALASHPVSSADPNLRLKTNSRAVYDLHLAEHPSVDEVLLYNERHFLTEFCRGNVVLELDGRCLSPRPSSGCLPGIGVADLVGRGEVAYEDISLADLPRATGIWFVNSVTGRIPVTLDHRPGSVKLHSG